MDVSGSLPKTQPAPASLYSVQQVWPDYSGMVSCGVVMVSVEGPAVSPRA